MRLAGVCCLLAVACGHAAEGTPVLMVGDSMMRVLGIAMEKEFKAAGIQPASSQASLGSGLIRGETFDWYAKIAALMAERKPATVIVLIGINDRQAILTPEKKMLTCGTEEWREAYGKAVGRFMDAILAGGARRVIWLLAPDMRDEIQQEHADTLNAVFMKEAAVETRRNKVTLFDLRSAIARHPGKYTQFVMSPTGSALSVRDADGIHFSMIGGQRVAQAVIKRFFASGGN
jgi:hypothetical protein